MYKLFLLSVFYFITFLGIGQSNDLELDYKQAEKWAKLPLHCLNIEYPNKLNQVLTDSTFLMSPKKLHPIFYGCFDWHSAVHGYWLLVYTMNKFPDTELANKITLLLNSTFTVQNVLDELRYFEPALEKSFERTYGWAWLLKLHEELLKSPLNEKHQWTNNLQPLTDYIVDSYQLFLPKLLYPIRVGEHTNTAFGLSLALDYAKTTNNKAFEQLIIDRSIYYYQNDCDCALTWEPSGFDFISPCLQEAELMSKILSPSQFEKWLKSFLPPIFKKNFELIPGQVADRTDGKLVHLDGLNFSRAWALYTLAEALPKMAEKLISSADQHLISSAAFVSDSDYMGSHWLATFLVYALDKRLSVVKK